MQFTGDGSLPENIHTFSIEKDSITGKIRKKF